MNLQNKIANVNNFESNPKMASRNIRYHNKTQNERGFKRAKDQDGLKLDSNDMG